MIRMTVILTAVLLSVSFAQDAPKPTPEQCKADANAWYNYSRDSGYDKLSITEVGHRIDGMAQCVSVAKDSKEQSGYMGVIAMYALDYRRRESDFINRHGLWNTLVAEDEAGKR